MTQYSKLTLPNPHGNLSGVIVVTYFKFKWNSFKMENQGIIVILNKIEVEKETARSMDCLFTGSLFCFRSGFAHFHYLLY